MQATSIFVAFKIGGISAPSVIVVRGAGEKASPEKRTIVSPR